MLTLRRRVAPVWVFLVLLPVVTCVLWLSSGREMLTKSSRAIEFELQDAMFGDTINETHFVPGPILGYYIGLDAVAVTFGFFWAMLALAGVLRWIRTKEQWNSDSP
jgi:hypothetical protein